ncbi:hypothetical protein ACFSM5_04495 [Lacibacterium aquatile]|uniref:Uncharacterized protein n=1 Tax=Lacibacterium aquatile TaxID=1168082 RepID=A0ABW5DS74_9PROT
MIITLPIALIAIIPLWRIFDRAGITPIWSLAVFIPVIGLVLVVAILAFSRWPSVEDDIQILERKMR